MDRYFEKANLMRYDREIRNRSNLNNGGVANLDMSDWGNAISPPSSRYGEDDTSSVTHQRPRRSRLDKDIQAPPVLQPARPSSRKNPKNGGNHHNLNVPGGINPNLISGRRSVGHNSTFNGYDMQYQRTRYAPSRNANDTFSGRFPPNRNVSNYAIDYLNSQNGVGLLPNKMREPTRPRSTVSGRYLEPSASRNTFGGYESGEYSSSADREQRAESEEEEESEEDEDELREYHLQAQRAQGSRSVTTTIRPDPYLEGGEAYYFGVVHLDLELVAHVMKTIPPLPEYYNLQPIEKVAYIFYCAVYKKAYHSIEEFHKRFNREFYKFVCAGDSNDLALFKICKSMQDQYTLRQLEASKRAYEQAQKEALENEKLDFNKRRSDGVEDHHVDISQPEDVLDYGPLKFHTGHAFASFGIGGKMVIIRPAGSVDPINGATLNTTNVAVEDLRLMLHMDELSGKIIESVQNFKGPLIAGQTPTHSVRLYVQRQIDALKVVQNSGDVKKSEVIDALLIWQLLEIMVQQHGRVTGPDVATLLTNASEELSERTGVIENSNTEANSKSEAKERFNKFLLGGHINEAVESAISDGLYADAMTLIRRLHPNDTKKIEEIETRFMHLRSVDDPFATLVAVSSDQPPPILTNSSFDDDNNWKRHAAIILANLNSPTAMQTIYHLGLMLSKRERHSAADFCLLVVCILAGYDPFIPILHSDGEEKSRKHIGLVHGGSHLLNRVDGLKGSAGFSFTDLHATDIFDYALRLSNNNVDSPLARSKEYQAARIEYAKKLSSYGGFATDAFRYCTEVARSLWPYVTVFDRTSLVDLCDLAESLQYVAAASPAEVDWITSMRTMISNVTSENPVVEQNGQESQHEVKQQIYETTAQEKYQADNGTNQLFSESQHVDSSLQFEAQQWHDDHQTPIEMMPSKNVEQLPKKPEVVQPEFTETKYVTENNISSPPTSRSETEHIAYESSNYSSSTANVTSSDITTTSNVELTVPPPISVPPMPSVPPTFVQPPVSTPPPIPPPSFAQTPPPVSKPMPIVNQTTRDNTERTAKSPRSELEDLWSSPTSNHTAPSVPNLTTKPMPVSAPAKITQQKTAPQQQKPSNASSKNQSLVEERKSSNRGWFGSIKEKVIKSIPSANQMILPDDSTPQIRWDPAVGKYVGAGVEEEVVAAPPPVMSAPLLNGGTAGDSNKSSTASLRNARSGAGSRYFKPAMSSSTNPSSPMDSMSSMVPPPMMPLPTSFGFIPTANDDDGDDHVDPFSGQVDPIDGHAHSQKQD